uniref:Uncharacterized protein n=1 Tax=Cacopsylla melanoneura TaxID=428564 RepID=A0A8D9E8K2_9HEMI
MHNTATHVKAIIIIFDKMEWKPQNCCNVFPVISLPLLPEKSSSHSPPTVHPILSCKFLQFFPLVPVVLQFSPLRSFISSPNILSQVLHLFILFHLVYIFFSSRSHLGKDMECDYMNSILPSFLYPPFLLDNLLRTISFLPSSSSSSFFPSTFSMFCTTSCPYPFSF